MRRTCATCEVSWPSSAVWCGHCGKPLRDTRDLAAAPDASPVNDGRFRNLIIVALLVAMIGLLVAAAVRGPLAPALGAGDETTAVPTPDKDGPAQHPDAEELRCEPAGCELWRVDLDHSGGIHVLRDAIYHLGRHEVLAIEHEDGTIRWRTPIEVRGRDQATILELDEGLLVVSTPDLVHLLDAETGKRHWTTDWGLGSHAFMASLHGEVVTLGGPGCPADTEERPDLPCFGIGSYDVATGDLQWERWGVDPISADELLVLANGHLHALDPQTGEERWSRPVQNAWGQGWRGVTGDHVAIANSDGVLDVLDAATGDIVGALPEALAELDLARHPHGLQVHAFEGFVHVQVDAGTTGEEWSATLYDLASGEVVRRYDTAFWPWPIHGLWVVPWHDGEGTRLDAFDAATGEPLWEVALPDSYECCPWAQPGTQGTLILHQWERDATTRTVLQAETGEILDRSRVENGPEGRRGDLRVGHDGNSTRLTGSGGFAVFSQRMELVFSPGPVLVQNLQSGTLVRVHDEMLFGEWRPLPPE